MPFFKEKKSLEEKLTAFRNKRDAEIEKTRAKFDNKEFKFPISIDDLFHIRLKTDKDLYDLRKSTDNAANFDKAFYEEQISTNKIIRIEEQANIKIEFNPIHANNKEKTIKAQAELDEIRAHNKAVFKKVAKNVRQTLVDAAEEDRRIRNEAILRGRAERGEDLH